MNSSFNQIQHLIFIGIMNVMRIRRVLPFKFHIIWNWLFDFGIKYVSLSVSWKFRKILVFIIVIYDISLKILEVELLILKNC